MSSPFEQEAPRMHYGMVELVLLVLAFAIALTARGEDTAPAPSLERLPESTFELQGVVQEYVQAVTRNWLLKMPDENPAVLQMFADRDQPPYRQLLPWSGEFAGKYLTGAVQVLRLTHDKDLKACLEHFVRRLVQLQDADGYLGPFPQASRLTGKAPNAGDTWDAWGHYHIMLGLLLWADETRDPRALDCATKIGDLLCARYLKTGKRVVDMGSAEMNQAVVHSLCLLYRKTRTPKHLELAQQIVEEFQADSAGDYVRNALAGREFFQCRKPRWESLHPIMGLAELYWLTGNNDYRGAFERIWWSIAKLDRHNNGGFSSGEQAQGNPYHGGAIETCCTVAWAALSVEMLRLTGNSIVADELELATLNAIIGYQSRTGLWCTYNTPMSGSRKRSTMDIAFQVRPGSEAVNCCSANAPRGFGMISDWALMTDGKGLILNWYGPATMTARLDGTHVALRQHTGYPRDGRITLEVSPERPLRFPLKLRVPHWSAVTRVWVNGEPVPEVKAGTYLAVDRLWNAGDKVELDLDLSLHYWMGERECAGKASVYRGPILLTFEREPQRIAFSRQFKQYGDLWAAREKGATVEFGFEGTAVRWLGRKFDDAGKAQVSIDGKEVAVVDQFGPGRGLPFSWECEGLAPGRHNLKLTVLDQKNEESKDYFINVVGLATPGAVPELDARALTAAPVGTDGPGQPLVLVEVAGPDGARLRLRDFGTAGEEGKEYLSWLNVRNIAPVSFAEANPLRSARPQGDKRDSAPLPRRGTQR